MPDNTTVTPIAEAPFSANFKLFDPEGVQVQFTVRAVSADEHLNNLAAYRQALAAQGFAPSEPAAEEGKVEEVAAYVRGATKAGQPLVWLYSSKDVLKWRVTTVYQEDLGSLPFTLEGLAYPAGAVAPERETAENAKYLQKVTPFKVVLAENGKDENGKMRWKFSHVAGQAPRNGNGNGAPAPAAAAAPAPVQAPTAAVPTNGNGNNAGTPACPKCAGAMWDNRSSKKNPAAPDFKCKDKACDGVIWPPKNGNGAKAPAAAAPAGNGSNVPF